METACTRLIEDACANGGKDNVTAILVQVVGEGDSA
jgi:serine/threonine protein phosphatase PrpC